MADQRSAHDLFLHFGQLDAITDVMRVHAWLRHAEQLIAEGACTPACTPLVRRAVQVLAESRIGSIHADAVLKETADILARITPPPDDDSSNTIQ